MTISHPQGHRGLSPPRFNTQWFKTLITDDNVNKVITWSDRGTHFADKHNMYWWLCELVWEYFFFLIVVIIIFLCKNMVNL